MNACFFLKRGWIKQMNNSDKKNETDESERMIFQGRFESGQLVEGIVVQHAPFGMFVDLGNPRFPALAELPGMESLPGPQPGAKEIVWPAVGSHIKAIVVMPFYPEKHQLHLLVRPTALRAAAALQLVADLPAEEREGVLLQALSSQEPDLPSAAAWRVRYLPLYERGTFLRQALTHWDTNVAASAVWRVGDLPREERATFLRLVVQHEDQGVATLAVWMAKHLSMPERRLFLQEAAQHPFSEVNAQARFELGRLPLEE
jgi:hypothetical protein